MLTEEKDRLINMYKHCVSDVQADALYEKYLHLYDGTLYVKNTPLDLSGSGKLILAGSGKASLSMGRAILPYLPRHWDDSLFISPSEAPDGPFRVIRGDHPVPGNNSLGAGNRMLELISSLNKNDTLIYFLSGGSSSLMDVPVEGISLEDIRTATQIFLSSGMTINEINTLRVALSQVKAGKLADRCKARCYVFVLSDVMGNDLATIGSGPFYPTRSSFEKIDAILEKYHIKTIMPDTVIKAFPSYEPVAGKDIPHFLIGSNMDLLQAAETACFDKGITPLCFPESLFGDAAEAGKMIADMVKLYSGKKPVCMIFGGETTVTLNDNPGLGGRSQELALSVLQELKDMHGISLLSAGSDGMDGTGGAAGAVISSETYQKAEQRGLSIQSYLANHDSYHFHEQCGSLITTGYSGTNVGDVVMAVISEDLPA